MSKTILVLLDGCGYEASAGLGYLEHLVESGLGAKYRVTGGLPSLSRPMYETLLTGLPAHVHGIRSNLTVRPSAGGSLFSLCRENGLTTAAAAYHWMSELYHASPFRCGPDRFLDDPGGLIQHGIFYYEDFYPDSHVLADAEYLRRLHDPDLLLVHTMNIDDAGHKYGAGSAEYAAAAAKAGILLSEYLPLWLEEGYSLLVTADHGMNAHRLHGGNTPQEREAPLYLFDRRAAPGFFGDFSLSCLAAAPLACALLNIPPAPGMLPRRALGVAFLD